MELVVAALPEDLKELLVVNRLTVAEKAPVLVPSATVAPKTLEEDMETFL